MIFNVEFNEDSCHICLSNEGNKEHINENDLKVKYLELTAVEVLNAKGMPSYICEFCKSKLIIAVHFKKQCLMSHKLLQKYFEVTIEAEKAEAEIMGVLQVTETENVATEVVIESVEPETEKSSEVYIIDEKEEADVVNVEKKVAKKRKLKPKSPEAKKTRHSGRPKRKPIEIIEIEEETQHEEPEQQKKIDQPEINTTNEPKVIELENYKIQIGTDDDEDDEGKSHDEKKDTCIGVIELKGIVKCRQNDQQTKIAKKYKVSDGTRVSYMWMCPICHKMQHNIKQHMSVHTGERKYKCTFCDKAFAQKGNLKNHVNIHTGYKPYQCQECDKSFSEPNSLRSHMVFHSKEKKYHCEFCGKKFGYAHTLTAHRRTHTNERPYSCDICNKSFLVRHTLTKHIRTHTGERPYRCEICDKAFMSSGNLSTHRIVHTKVRRFSCHICDMKFAYKNVLNTHVLKLHKAEDFTSLVSEPEENSELE